MKTLRASAVVGALLLASMAQAQTVTLPAEIKVSVGRLAAVKIEYDGDDVRWDVPPALDCFREYDPDPKVVRLRLLGPEAGEYRLLAVAAKGGKLSDFAACKIIVGEPAPPTPTPIPIPVDPEAVPSAALKKAMADAYAMEMDPHKADYASKYVQVIREVIPILKSSGRVKTAKEFFDEIHNTMNVALQPAGPNAIPMLRQAAGQFIQTRLPTSFSAPTDEAYWKAASVAHSQVAQAILMAVKGAK